MHSPFFCFISKYIGVDHDILSEYIAKAPTTYKIYNVPKKNKKEYRRIYHPAKQTKAIQHAAIEFLSDNRLIHKSAMGYIKGKKSPLKENATYHSKFDFTIRIDIKDFFPSITPSDLKRILKEKTFYEDLKLQENDFSLIEKIFFVKKPHTHKKILGIGAPSSPYLSNVVMFDFDKEFNNFATSNSGVYTRYVDDLFFSSDSPKMCKMFYDYLKTKFEETKSPKLSIKKEKTYLASKYSRRVITGLVITPDYQVKLPRTTKRYIRKLINDYKHKGISEPDIYVLKGYLALLFDVEPEYINNLITKYSSLTINEIFRYGN